MQVTDAQVRRWLEELRNGRSPYDAELIALMRRHGYSAADKTRDQGAQDAAQFLRDKIEGLQAPRGASTHQQMPHAVLTLCWVQDWKSTHAAKHIGISGRQMSRERSRAVRLLCDALTHFPDGAPAGETDPPTWGEMVAQLNRIEAAVMQIAATR